MGASLRKGGLASIIMQGMVIYMNEQQLQTLEQLQAFLDGTVAIDLRLAPAERYACKTVRSCNISDTATYRSASRI